MCFYKHGGNHFPLSSPIALKGLKRSRDPALSRLSGPTQVGLSGLVLRPARTCPATLWSAAGPYRHLVRASTRRLLHASEPSLASACRRLWLLWPFRLENVRPRTTSLCVSKSYTCLVVRSLCFYSCTIPCLLLRSPMVSRLRPNLVETPFVARQGLKVQLLLPCETDYCVMVRHVDCFNGPGACFVEQESVAQTGCHLQGLGLLRVAWKDLACIFGRSNTFRLVLLQGAYKGHSLIH
jgi:hypothetical protein